MHLPVRVKALAYVIRPAPGSPPSAAPGSATEVLVFAYVGHSESGLQVPVGTVETGERPLETCLREVEEETGVNGPRAVRTLGEAFLYAHAAKRELHRRHVFVLDAPPGLPEAWTHTVTGDGNDRGRRFACRWLEASAAARTLALGEGTYLARALDRRR